jgi:anthranilate synthase component 2
MNILLVDNYDSFTYNLSLLVKSITGKHPVVQRNDRIDLESVQQYDKIMLSPGPGVPVEAGQLLELIQCYAPSKSILGVCLGHQAIGQAFGAALENRTEVYHGIAATAYTNHNEDPLFKSLGSGFEVGRYHSWVVSTTDFPDQLEVTATDQQGLIMALRHKTYDVRGLQFHPESILTPMGRQIIENWLRY